ncbi:MAG: cation:proton antiporter subunit C [Euryarchaeota archaeon]|nr:cation:proton antiporter subunit C [Euryarchaeota archaeon]
MIDNIPFIACALLMILGLYALVFKRNLIKIAIGLNLVECGVNLFLITLGYRSDSVAPIYTMAAKENMALPTPQALTLTSIVIGLATTALILSFAILIYKHYKTVDASKVRRLRG